MGMMMKTNTTIHKMRPLNTKKRRKDYSFSEYDQEHDDELKNFL